MLLWAKRHILFRFEKFKKSYANKSSILACEYLKWHVCIAVSLMHIWAPASAGKHLAQHSCAGHRTVLGSVLTFHLAGAAAVSFLLQRAVLLALWPWSLWAALLPLPLISLGARITDLSSAPTFYMSFREPRPAIRLVWLTTLLFTELSPCLTVPNILH